jgi:hypothetical protein
MPNHELMQLSDTEWREVMAIPKVREGWALTDDVPVDDFRSNGSLCDLLRR